MHILFIHANQRLALNAVARGRRAEALEFAGTALHAGREPAAGFGLTPSAAARPWRDGVEMYAALMRSPLRAPSDQRDAVSWLTRSLDGWRASQSEPGFGEPHRREMQEVEVALARAQSPSAAHITPGRR